MTSGDDFWLHLVRLADSYADCGATPAERAGRAMRQFESMPPVAQREIASSLRSLAYQLPDLYMIAAAQMHKLDIQRHIEEPRAEAG